MRRAPLRDLPVRGATLLIATLSALMIFGVLQKPPVFDASARPAGVAIGRGADLALYRAIESRIGAGEDYYPAALAEQRARHFPLRPFVAVRLPTIATINGKLGSLGSTILLASLAALAIALLVIRLHAEVGKSRTLLFASGAAAIAIGPLGVAESSFHEPWAAVLIVLSLAVRSQDRFAASVILGMAATLSRELAAPYLVVMAAAAAIEGARREALAWLGACCLVATIIGMHAFEVASLVGPDDLRSPGWAARGGWPFVLQIVHDFTSFAIIPTAVSNALVPLALLGWIGMGGALGLRGALLLFGYAGLFIIFGRPDNGYWGVMLAPLLPLGLVFAPVAALDLILAVVGRHSSHAAEAMQLQRTVP